jgi:hypothetical protein
VLQVGAQTIVATVLAGSALDIGEERRAHFANQGFGGVDQGQTLLDIFIAQAITEMDKIWLQKNFMDFSKLSGRCLVYCMLRHKAFNLNYSYTSQ